MYTVPMKYPAEFVARAKKLYPHNTKLHQALDSGSDNVSLYLDANCKGTIDCSDVLQAKSLRELKAIARRDLDCLQLYNDYCRLIYGD